MRNLYKTAFSCFSICLLIAIVPSQALAASISGHVYQEGTTTPIANVNVNIYTGRCYDGHVTGGQTNAEGYYEFSGLTDGGQYIVRVDANNQEPYYASEWYNDIRDIDGCENATFVNADSSGVDFYLTSGGAISGTINNSSGPVTGISVGVNVYAGDPCGNHEVIGGLWTNSTDGTFIFAGIPEGTYFLRTYPAESNYVSTWWTGAGGSLDCDNAESFGVTAGQTVIGRNFVLNEGGTIHGNVSRTSDGSPIANLWVSATNSITGEYWDGGMTDSNGDYVIIGLPAASYKIRAESSGSDFAFEWYPEAISWDDANPVAVTAGEHVYNIDFTLDSGGSITGRVTDAESGQPMSYVWVEAHLYDSGHWGNGASTDESGNYEIDGLPAGDYRVRVATWDVPNVLEEYYDDSHDWNTASRVAVTAGSSTDNIDMALDYGFDHDASVVNIHQPDDSFTTYYSFYPHGYSGPLPDDVTSVTVETPVSHTVHNLAWDADWDEFSALIPGSPEPGVHVFTATMADGNVVVSTDYQYVIQTIPNPDTEHFSPSEGAVVTSKTPIFTWDPVELSGVPLYYRFEVADDATGQRVFASSRNLGMTSITLAEGTLGPGSYRWRVRVSDSGDWVDVQNRANSDWLHFTVSDTLDPHDALPAIDPNNWNGLTWIGGNAFAASVKVIDLDGVAYNGSSHTLKVTPPDGETFPDGTSEKTAELDVSNGPTACYYWVYVDGGTPVSGEYTFTVTDPDGNQTSFVEQVDVNPLAAPDEASIEPGNYDETITATFDNVRVNGVPYDNFDVADGSPLDPSKWKWPSEAEIVNNRLQFNLANFVGRAHGGVAFTHIEPITSVTTDIAITSMSDSSTSKYARIAGAFFNDGSNADFWVSLWNNGSEVGYSVSRQWFNGEGNYQWETVQREKLVDAAVGDVVTMSVAWDETNKTLTFAADNPNNGQSKALSYVHNGPVYPPITQDFGFHIRINLTTSTTPTFSWDPVTGASRYRLRIYTYDNSRTVYRGYTGGETSITVPPGVLEPDSYYRLRLDAYDKPSPLSVDNYSRTPANFNDFYRFYTNSEVPQAPYIDLDGGGVQTVQSDEPGVIPVFWVRVSDRQGVPENIASVTVQFPAGHQETLYLNNTDGPYNGFYQGVSTHEIEEGVYTFTVIDRDGNTDTITDELVYAPIGYPVASSLSAIVGEKEIQVSWNPVDGAEFYRLEIYNEAYERIQRLTVDAEEGSSIAVPRGLLEEGPLYRYRVRTYREFYSDITGSSDTEGNNDNSSQIPWRSSEYPTFVLSPVSGGSSDPTIDLDNQGVFVSHAWDPVLEQDVYILGMVVKVSDADGVPGNIERVYASLPNTTEVDLTFDESISSTEAYYHADLRFYNIADVVALEGNFIFTVDDLDEGSASTAADNLSGVTTNMLAVPSNLSPVPDALVTSTTPTISWDAVDGAISYRVRIFNSRHDTIYWSDYIADPTTSWEVPFGILEPGTTYAYRVYAYRGDFPAEDLDFNSFSILYYSWSPHFSVSTDPDSDGDGISDEIEQASDCLLPDDADSDDDGILDGLEDTNLNGIVDSGETDPCEVDTDGDGIQDGTESGLTDDDIGPDTDTGVFVADLDPTTTTDPLSTDTDGDGKTDGEEDPNFNGRVDGGESDPNAEESKMLPSIPLLLLGD